MKLISFDVGTKNLAYCLLDTDDVATNDTNNDKDTDKTDKYKYTIQEWGIFDLTNKQVFKCGANQKRKPYNICGKSASYIDNQEYYYCKQHAKSCEYLIPTKQMTDTSLKKAKVGELKQLATYYNIDYTPSILKPVLLKLLQVFRSTHFLQPLGKETGDIGLVAMSINMTNKLNRLLQGITIDYVLIENQISKIASTMKTIQGMITQYFVMRDIINIHYISSSNKLKMFIIPKSITTYTERKTLGIQYTRTELIGTQDNKWLLQFEDNKKKDDLADSFLQGLWYINMKLRTT
jgi:hypothetical protein